MRTNWIERRVTVNRIFLLVAVFALCLTAAAKEMMEGKIVSESTVNCGTQDKGKKKTVQMMCQEYVIRTDTTEYHVRQEKESHKDILPVNAPVELSLSKDKMKFKVNGKEYEMMVVSEAAAPAGASSAHSATPANQDTPVQK
jgi:hypothetical protein